MIPVHGVKQSFVLIVSLLFGSDLLSQKFDQCTTAEFLIRSKKTDGVSLSGYDGPINFALPLIDSAVAMELTRFPGQFDNNAFMYLPYYGHAVALQLKDSSLQQSVFSTLMKFDSLCNKTVVTANDYGITQMNIRYEYTRLLINAMLNQVEKHDTSFLKIATERFEFWARFVIEHNDKIPKTGFKHFSAMKKEELDPCAFASFNNSSLWARCIYLLTGKKEYGSSNEQFNKVYKSLMSGFGAKKDPDERADYVRLGKPDTISLDSNYKSLDSMDFEHIADIKEKFDKVRKSQNWHIKIYTCEGKALVFTNHSDETTIQFHKTVIDFPKVYLVELITPSIIQIREVSFRERYY